MGRRMRRSNVLISLYEWCYWYTLVVVYLETIWSDHRIALALGVWKDWKNWLMILQLSLTVRLSCLSRDTARHITALESSLVNTNAPLTNQIP